MKSPRTPGVISRNRDFRQLFIADSISRVGTEVSYLALSLLAVVTLHATPLQLGLLQAAQTAAFLLVGLPAGAWVDRLPKRPMLLTTDLARFALFASIPLAALLDVLTMTQLVVVALLAGVATVLFDVAHYAYLPAIVPAPDRAAANARFASTLTIAQVAGPGVSGGVVKLLGAPVAVLLDALTYLTSYVFVRRITSPEPERTAIEERNLGREIREGLSFLIGTPALRRIAVSIAGFNVMGAVEAAVTVLFLVRTVGLGPGVVGLLFTLSGVGGVTGALLAGRIVERRGLYFCLARLPLLTTPFVLLVPLTDPGARLLLFVVGFGALGFGVSVFNVAQNTYRQSVVPARLLGRVSACLRVLTWGAMPVGGLVGGVLATHLGARSTLWLACGGFALSVVALLRVRPEDVADAPAPSSGDAAVVS